LFLKSGIVAWPSPFGDGQIQKPVVGAQDLIYWANTRLKQQHQCGL
jgi:hypothetical protein